MKGSSPQKGLIFLLVFLMHPSLPAQNIPWYNEEPLNNYGDIHDPAVIRDNRGVYTMMSTNNLLEVVQSDDLMNWNVEDQIFNAVPNWITQINADVGDIWAPDIVHMDDRYWVYYCGSSFGSNNSVIGVVSTPTLDVTDPNYGWTDHGLVIQSEGTNFNAIDPGIIQDYDGNWWMVFGSYWSGIHIVKIDPATGMRTDPNNTIHNIAARGGDAIEGPSIIKHGGYYYLFTSWDACCEGVNSTYRTMVGRAEQITGPYVDKNGNNLLNNNATELLAAYDRYIGPGGGSVFRDGRRDYLAHHYYNEDENGLARVHFREIVWNNNDWPVLTQPFIGRRQAFEAEHAKLTNADIADGNNASNNSYVTSLDDPANSRIVFYIKALQAGTYRLHIRYAAGNGNASHYLQVNNEPEREIQYPGTGGWGAFPEGQSITTEIELNEGYNQLSFRPATGTAELDRVDLFRPASEVIEAGSYDERNNTDYIEANNNGFLESGGWSMFEYVDFENGGYKSLLIKAGGSCNGTLTFSMDDRSGTPDTSINVANVALESGDTLQTNLPDDFRNLTNVHDVYYEYNGSQPCTLDHIQFRDTTTTVPVKFVEVNAHQSPSGVKVQWKTANEINNKRFEVQRMGNQTTAWNSIAAVKGNNSSKIQSYRVTDHNPIKGVNYYRIRQIDENGSVHKSRVVHVNYNLAELISVYPNPSTGAFNLSWQKRKKARVKLKIYNETGKLIQTTTVPENQQEIKAGKNLEPGVYFLHFIHNNSIIHKKLVKL